MRAFDSAAELVRDKFIEQGEFEARYFSLLMLGLAYVGGLLHAALLFKAGAIGEGQVVAYLGLITLFQFPVFISLFTAARIASGIR